MDERPHSRQDSADERRFALSVWPQTAERPWQAEVSAAGSPTPFRFYSPVALVLFLTELSGSPDRHPRGLR